MHNVGVQPPPPQQQQQQPPQPLDNISKIKSLIGPLKDSLSVSNSCRPNTELINREYCTF